MSGGDLTVVDPGADSGAASDVKSPCISVCALNDEGFCMGCWRSVDEIAAWSGLDNASKRAVVRLAQQRARDSGYWL